MNNSKKHSLIYDLLLIVILVAAAFLRLKGSDWGELQHQHPDELFITGVVSNLRAHTCIDEAVPIDSCPPELQRWLNLSEYFDTSTSTLNPANRGNEAYVYGTLPIFMLRATAEFLPTLGDWLLAKPIENVDFIQWAHGLKTINLKLLGRQFSAFADLGTLLLLYFIVKRLYDSHTALLATAFSAFTVTQIQQSHFFTTDLFVNLFGFLAIYFAVRILTEKSFSTENTKTTEFCEQKTETAVESTQSVDKDSSFNIFHSKFLRLSIAFGIAFGMALASKVNIFPLAALLPLAFIVRGLSDPAERERMLKPVNFNKIIVYLIVGGLAALITFRVFQPYAFDGIGINQLWMDKIAEQRVQARGDADLPWNLQWARRTHLYSFENLTIWGLGLPLGILAWAGFLLMGWRIIKGERKHLLLWSWTGAYFFWQSMQFNPTMRYQLPIYPLMAMMAAWSVFKVASCKFKVESGGWKTPNLQPSTLNLKPSTFNLQPSTLNLQPSTFNLQPFAYSLGTLVLLATIAWGYAFHTIYTREETRMAASRWIYQNVPGAINLHIQKADGETFSQPLLFNNGTSIQADNPYTATFVPMYDGILTEVSLGHLADSAWEGERTFRLLITKEADSAPEQILAQAAHTANFASQAEIKSEVLNLVLDTPLPVKKGEYYTLRLESDGGIFTIRGSALANETSYDFGLPFRIDGFDAFGGIYRGDLNLEVYWDDNADKLERFTDTLNQADYILIPTNHQYAQITRLPERYPLTTEYYRQLIGCPAGENIIACYREAQPDAVQGNLGFDLVAVFESYPTIGNFRINDQAAEEAFTFYDHPKVLIFKKNANYDAAHVAAILGAVDLSQVVHLLPKEAADYEPPKDLMLSEDEWARQREGGTWSELFNVDALRNKYPVLGLLLWYFTFFILGLFTYPIVRRIFPGLSDKGYPLSRAFGLLLLAYFSWLLGSFGIAYSRLTITFVFGSILLLGGYLGYKERAALKKEWQEKRNYYLMIEGLFLAFFLIDLLIRIGNPDLWHPSKGGERPMDLSYLQAVLKSTTFPPYDPWFAGGYLNYYYFGFVLVGTPIKLLGLIPTTAYNYILPTLFAMVGVGAFSIGWNLLERYSIFDTRKPNIENRISNIKYRISNPRFIAGISSAFAMILLGNLGTIRAVYHAFQRIIDPEAHYADISVFEHLWFAMQGFWEMLTKGAILPLRMGDWYWFPSRVIPAPGDVEPITEFPLFTFLYSDLHAHMIVLPLAILAIAWAVSFLYARLNGKRDTSQTLLEIAGASLIVGAMRPTNTWDLYAYLPLLMVIIGYTLFKSSQKTRKDSSFSILHSSFYALLGMAIFFALSSLFFQPYIAKFGQAYGEIHQWEGSHTPLSSYFTQWGLFLFIIVSWMWWQTHEWMAETPLSALKEVKREWVNFGLAILLAMLIGLAYLGVSIGWIALPLLFWAGVLIFRQNLGEGQRLVLFLVGTALTLTIVVEVIVLSGDIGRMNTVFKLYLQAWTFLALSAGASLGWLLPETKKWTEKWQSSWKSVGMVLLAGAFLFTLIGTLDKIRDRVQSDAPAGLDGMKYMQTASYWDSVELDLSQDYAGILWMRENVQGSPVIIEANTPEYRWGSRYTIYTGLPGVIGWNWHQRQQRALTPHLVTDRVAEVKNFYETSDIKEALAFIEKYHIEYIIVGQVERAYYLKGLEKFKNQEGNLWDEVFAVGETRIYEVR